MVDRLGPYLLGPNDTPENGIYTGDARELAEAIPDESVDLVLTDPPYGIGFDYTSGYDDSPERYPKLLQWIIAQSMRIVKPGGLCFVFIAQPQLRDVLHLFPADARIFAACKNFVQYRPTAVQFAYDPVLFWKKEGPCLVQAYAGKRDWHIGNHANTNARDYARMPIRASRPLNTITYMVEGFCPPDGVTVDFFLGGGTTAVAAFLMNRRWWGTEIDPATADLARERVRNTQPPLFVQEPEQLALEV